MPIGGTLSYQQPNQPQNGPQWAQQPQPQWGPPQPPAPKKKRGCLTALAVVGVFFVVLIVAFAAAGGGSKNKGTDNAGTTPSSGAPAAPTTAPAAAKPKAVAKPITVLTESGHGIKTTAKFTVHGDWDLHYTYDCSSFGFKGNFVVTGEGGGFPDVMVNELGNKGSDTTHQHDGGTLYLDINSECSWTVKVIDIP